MITYEQIKAVSDSIKTTDIKGKQYAGVAGRINAFRRLYPQGFITTEIIRLEDGLVVMKATCGYYEDGKAIVIGTGTAYEKEGTSNINRTSYIENCESSSVGRALGMCGLGISTEVASAEEVSGAINQQEQYKENADGQKRVDLMNNIMDMVHDYPSSTGKIMVAKAMKQAGINNRTLGTLLVPDLENVTISLRSIISTWNDDIEV